ncbi:MAG: fused MFS/spermidine synthase [Chitinispirillaceae bacterium]|nr:fused MFS/spermidine synthase [Chitinispirillaceae bacterium]
MSIFSELKSYCLKKDPEINSTTVVSSLYFLLFFLSGVAGLIYESIWSHYLKLFLGHAAYSQTLVLVIYMGGMAAGAWIAGALLKKIRNCLKMYAVVEIVLGVAALAFHPVFQWYINVSYDNVIPFLDNPTLIFCYKWITSSIIILPQSMLLGSTFPLMAAGFIRRFPGSGGYKLTFLYFANTFGASAGVLLSGFVLIGSAGLPGTIVTAGIIDIIVGCAVLSLCWRDDTVSSMVEETARHDCDTQWDAVSIKRTHLVLILFAGATAAASFMYEIGWIRMLSLVLGSSTHSFEMMLSSFILGMALGSFFIRKRIDKIRNIPMTLVIVQVLMGLTALISILIYSKMFHFMHFVMAALSKSEQGYVLFNLFSDVICMAVMLPSTICAGMVLPLIVHFFYRCGYGEEYIGKVYAVNTFGGIVGVIAATWLLMPLTGVRFLVTIGALIDVSIGLGLLVYFKEECGGWLRKALPAVSGAVIVVAIPAGNLDPVLMSSGVFRNGTIYKNKKFLSLKDGRTATIALYQSNDKMVLSTNGKVDASVDIRKGVSADEYTMSLAAVLPLAILQDSCSAAVIGMGSGMTAHYLLMDSTVRNVEVIEIEPAMVQAAKHIGKKVENTFKDPRSHIFIDDAKTFFSTGNRKYDIIVSEPSNPWVSGVAGLFSKEFFDRIRNHLTDQGVLVQWFHKYESDITILSSIFRALRQYFPHFQVYTAGSDIIVIAAKDSSTDLSLKRNVFAMPPVERSMALMGFQSLQDLRVLHFSSGNTFNAFLNVYDVEDNSDYFPYVDLYAVKYRYLDKEIYQLDTLRKNIVPVRSILDGDTGTIGYIPREKYPALSNFEYYHEAKRLYRDIVSFDTMQVTSEHDVDNAAYIFDYSLFFPSKINFGKLHGTLMELFEKTMPFLSPFEMSEIWKNISEKTAEVVLDDYQQQWMRYFGALCQRNYEELRELSFQLLPQNGDIEDNYINIMLIESFLAASKVTGNRDECENVLKRYEGTMSAGLMIRMLAQEIGIDLNRKYRIGVFMAGR